MVYIDMSPFVFILRYPESMGSSLLLLWKNLKMPHVFFLDLPVVSCFRMEIRTNFLTLGIPQLPTFLLLCTCMYMSSIARLSLHGLFVTFFPFLSPFREMYGWKIKAKNYNEHSEGRASLV